MKLKDALGCMSYTARLVLLKRDDDYWNYSYMFPACDLITRGTIEKFYPELLERELTNGCHADGIREGIYIHI